MFLDKSIILQQNLVFKDTDLFYFYNTKGI